MKERKTLDLTISAKACVLSMLVLVFFMLMIPVFQIGQNHEYRLRIASAEESIRQLDQVERTLKSEISMSRSPEALIDNVIQYSLDYDEIDSSSTVLVAKGSV